MKKKVVIVGAGVAGLTTAYKLLESEYEVIVVERDDTVGGLSKTYHDGEFAFDSGPHRFYTKNDKVIKFIEKVLDKEFLSMKMTSSVYIMGNYYDWPLSIKVVLKLPFHIMIAAGLDMIKLIFKKPRPVHTFKEQILQKYGKTLYKIDFDPYTHKFTKLPTEKIHADWAKAGVNRAVIDEKVKMDSIFAVVKSTLFPVKEKITIMYPQYGISDFSEKLSDMITKKGGQIILNAIPTKISKDAQKVQSIELSNGKVIENIDHLVWTGSINEIAKLLQIKERNLEYLNIVTYNIKIKGSPKKEDQWIYYVDSNVVFNRLYNTIKFSPYKAPKGTYGLCVEVTCRNNSKLLKNPEQLSVRVVSDLKKVRLIKNEDEILGITHHILYQSYPLYKVDYRTELRKAFDEINETVENLTLAGRNGLFWYNNMDHSIENAFDTAENIINNNRNIAINEFWK